MGAPPAPPILSLPMHRDQSPHPRFSGTGDGHAAAPMATVYWIKGRTEDIRRNLISQLHFLLRLEEVQKLVVPDASLAIKFNLSEVGYSHYLPPIIFSTLFEKTRALGAMTLLTDGVSLFKGSRFDGYNWTDAALMQG